MIYDVIAGIGFGVATIMLCLVRLVVSLTIGAGVAVALEVHKQIRYACAMWEYYKDRA